MPIVGELTGWLEGFCTDESLCSVTLDVELPAENALAKTSLGWFNVTGDFCNIRVGIRKIVRELPDATFGHLDFALEDGDPTLAFGDPGLIFVAFGIGIIDARVASCWTVEFWE